MRLKDTTGMTDWFERAGMDAFIQPYFDDFDENQNYISQTQPFFIYVILLSWATCFDSF